ncbi:MAG: hypothetical protein RLZZ416_202 [Candidatus Parcubacteria bacterium]|jgi:HAD superfamily hydrolase (TIGR01484 family)
MQCPKTAVFDLDDTLAESFKPPSRETLDGLKRLLDSIPVAIMTGAGFSRMEKQFLPDLVEAKRSDRLYIFPNSAAQSYMHKNGVWTMPYNEALTHAEREHIKSAIRRTVEQNETLRAIPHWGAQLFDREAQVAFTVVGIEATREMKKNWDPDGSKRRVLVETLKREIPEFEILMGGTTTVDITRKDINKAYGIRWLSNELGIPPEEMLYVGDAFAEGGNDRVVIPTGITTRAVESPEETLAIIRDLITSCSNDQSPRSRTYT